MVIQIPPAFELILSEAHKAFCDSYPEIEINFQDYVVVLFKAFVTSSDQLVLQLSIPH